MVAGALGAHWLGQHSAGRFVPGGGGDDAIAVGFKRESGALAQVCFILDE
jgi:hypothetical protein